MSRYQTTRVGTGCIAVIGACDALDNAVTAYHMPWGDYIRRYQEARSHLAANLREARSQNWRFRKTRRQSSRAMLERQELIHSLVNHQDKPKTWPEYLRELADDCDDCAEEGHAADHRTSAVIIDRLVATTRTLVFELTNFCQRNDITVDPSMQAQLEAASAACDSTNTIQAASAVSAA